MSKVIKKVMLGWTTVAVDTTSEVSFPASGWMGADEAATLRGTFETAARTGNMTVAIGYQTANVENAPDAAVAFTAFASTNTVTYPTAWTDISSATEGKQMIRFVWICKLSSGSTLAVIRVGGSVDVVGS